MDWFLYDNGLRHERVKQLIKRYYLRSQSTLSREIKIHLKSFKCLYTHFYNISLNVLRPNFLNICNLPISHFPNIRKIRVKAGPKTNYFSYFMSSSTDRYVVFNIFFHLYLANQETKKPCLRFSSFETFFE